MQSQFNVTSYIPPPAKPGEVNPVELADLLRQMLDIQREQLVHLKQAAAQQDAGAKWRALLSRWRDTYPDLGDGCKYAMPILEKAYGSLVAQLVDELRDQDPDAFDSEFTLQDFVDRYGIALASWATS